MQTTLSTHNRRRGPLKVLVAVLVTTAAVLSLVGTAAACTYRACVESVPTEGMYAEPMSYGAPTANLENLARNTRTAAKGVNAAVHINRYATTSNANVTITVGFGGKTPTSQPYSYSNGNKFSTVFPINDGVARYELIVIKFVERVGDRTYQFTLDGRVQIRPLWDVNITAIKLKMLDHCDTVFQGRAGEVQFSFTHSAASARVEFTLGKDETRWIPEFGATWTEVGVSNDLRVPTTFFYEDDWDKPSIGGTPALGEERLLPGNSRTMSWIDWEYGGDCRIQFTYSINLTPRYYAV